MDVTKVLTMLEEGLSADYGSLAPSINTKFIHEPWAIDRETALKKKDVFFGGEGYILLAKDAMLDFRKVVIKIASKQIRNDKKLVAKFFRGAAIQAKVASLLRHGVPEVYEAGHCWYVMEYVRGIDSMDFAERSVSQNDVNVIFCKLLTIVHIIHEFAIIHRDIKPENILISKDLISNEQYPVLLDWGLSKIIDKESETLTGIGAQLGSPGFMSDVLATDAARASPLDDIFALGRVYWCWNTRIRAKSDMEYDTYFMEHPEPAAWHGIYEKAIRGEYTTCLAMKKDIEENILHSEVFFNDELTEKIVKFIWAAVDARPKRKGHKND